MKNKYVGILYDKLTTAITSKIIADCMAMLSITDMYRMNLIICGSNVEELKSFLSPLIDDFSSDLSKPRLFVNYRAGSEYVATPDNCIIEVQRNFEPKSKSIRLYTGEKAPPSLKEDTRYSYSNISRMYNHQNGFAPPDAAMIMLWGPVKG